VLNDAMSALYMALSQMRNTTLTNSKDRVAEDQKIREDALNDEIAAIKRQEDAAKNGAFWQDVENAVMTVAQVALAVGAVAGTVATAGAASPLLVCAALALSAGGMVVSETKAFGDASGGVAAALEITGGVLTFGVGLATALAPAASTVTSTAASTVASTATSAAASAAESTAGSAAASTVAADAATSGSDLLGTVSTSASALGGGAEVVGGAVHIGVGAYAADAQNAAADAQQARHRMERMERIVRAVIDDAKDQDKSHERTLGSIQGAIQTNDQTAVIAASISVKG
jgi:hypothetical protein